LRGVGARVAAGWTGALSLKERVALLRADAGARVPHQVAESQLRYQQVRLARWQSEPQFATKDGLHQWLVHAGVSEEEFRRVLDDLPEVVGAQGDPPRWLRELRQAYAHSDADDDHMAQQELRLGWGQRQRGFLHIVGPLIAQAQQRLRAQAGAMARQAGVACFDPDQVHELLTANLLPDLLRMVNRTLVLELHLAGLHGELEGDTAEARFDSFVEILRDKRRALEVLESYPVLARQLTLRTRYWLESGLEFLRHLSDDWEDLRRTFSRDADPGSLVDVDGLVGDGHRQGRSVLIATFASGLRVVYKPRSLAADVHFNALLSWLNDHGAEPPFRALRVISRTSYGWMEFVDAAPCDSREEIRRFYRRQGGYLCLLYALEATDFHAENVLAVGEHPVLLDLEALLHPVFRRRDDLHAHQAAAEFLMGSVLRVGLLPGRNWATADSPGVDISGIGAADGQLTPYRVPYCEDAGTDRMRVLRKSLPMPRARNRPTLLGRDVELLDNLDEIACGFTHVYELLLEHREELLAAHGPISRFAGDELRVILRETRTYGELQFESLHPSLLRDGLDRDLLFTRLAIEVPRRPYLATVVEHEREQLWNGDLPIFTTRADSRDLWTGTGERIDDFFPESGLDGVRRRVRRLDRDDLQRQLWFIKASIAMLESRHDGLRRNPRPIHGADPVRPERLLSAARAVGDRLGALALWSDGEAAWVGMSLIRPDRWAITTLGHDLYDGTAGIALFLGQLGAVTSVEKYSDLARAATRTLKRQIDHERGSLSRIGGFTGWGGSIYALTHLGVLWSDPALLDRAEDLARLLVPLIELDDHHDVISGAAGCVAALARLHQVRPSAATLSAAIACGDHLLLRSRPAGGGRAWPNPALSERPLTGFSHGAAGIAWALLELGTLSGHERFPAAAREALAYERGLFDPIEANWPDLRTLADRSDTNAMTAWCHGAAGIGLGRLAMLRDMPDPALRAEVDIAVATKTAHGFGHNHSLCHGDLGNAELLRCAAEVLREPSLLSQVDRASARVLSEIDREGWVCGIPLEVESPGLMTGLAGIGHGLLRLAEPGMVPSVLLLAGPLGWGARESPPPHSGASTVSPSRLNSRGGLPEREDGNGNRASHRRADS